MRRPLAKMPACSGTAGDAAQCSEKHVSWPLEVAHHIHYIIHFILVVLAHVVDRRRRVANKHTIDTRIADVLT